MLLGTLSRFQENGNSYNATVVNSLDFGGREQIVYWQDGKGDLVGLANDLRDRLKNIFDRGSEAWRKHGVCVSLIGHLPVTHYTGEIFDGNCSALVPKDPSHAPAIWCFCKSPEFHTAVRKLDKKRNVTNATLVKVPFDLNTGKRVAAREYPNGLPEPHSDDPTQWLFKGHPKDSTDPLQVAVARLLGYHWPDQEPDALDALADPDGLVPISRRAGRAAGRRTVAGGLARCLRVGVVAHLSSTSS